MSPVGERRQQMSETYSAPTTTAHDYVAQIREELCTTRPARAGGPQGKRRYPLVVIGVLGDGRRQQRGLLINARILDCFKNIKKPEMYNVDIDSRA
jgi:hypothetical protein